MDKQPLEAVPKQKNNRKKKQKKDPIKVVYISNPLKVTLTVSEFKERVQELTGQDSDIADYMMKKKVIVASQPEEKHDKEEEEEEEEEEEATVLPSMPMASVASTDIQYLSTISTASIPGASTDLRKNDSFPFDAAFYDMSFTDLCYEESSQLLLDGW